jgi:hypothetical protein
MQPPQTIQKRPRARKRWCVIAQPVWVLSVDLQTKTATFQSGMADAAKSARGAFTEIKSGAGKMGEETGYSMMEARHGVMLLGEEFGVKMPRAIAGFIASIGPVGAAMEAAFPFLAIAVGATLIIEHLMKMREEGEKLTEDQVKFGTAAQNAFNTLDNKLLQAQIHADELRNDHLGALSKQLEVIDKQSMAELVHAFEEVAKAADVVFGDIKSHWYTFGIGSEGAKHALTGFKTEYDSLLSQGKNSEAGDLLKGTRESAEKVLALQKQAASTKSQGGQAQGSDRSELLQHEAALQELKKSGVGFTEKEVAAQQTLVDALHAQEQIESKVGALKKLESDNATKTVGKDIGKTQSEAAKQAAEHTLKMGELGIAAEREAANVRLTLARATTQERLASDLTLANDEYQIQLTANQQRIAALDKGGKDYQNQLKGLHQKTEELTAEHTNRIAQLQGKASEDQYRKDLTDMEQAEREKINATQQGSAERLAATDAAIKDEQSRNLQDTSFYRELLTQRVELVRKAAEDEAKEKAAAGKEEADQTLKLGELDLAVKREQMALEDSARHITIQRRLNEELEFANAEFKLKNDAMSKEMDTMDKGGKDYENKLRQLQDKQKQLTQQHENEITAIKDKAEIERNTRVLSAETHFQDSLAGGLTQSLMRHQSFAAAFTGIGNQVVSGMMQNAIKSVLANDYTKESDAAAAARHMYLAGSKFPFPLNVVMAPALGAMAFASVMAFQDGGVVPGSGKGDKIPAMLEPGEGVVPGGVMDGLRNMARSGNMGGGSHYHVNAHFAPQVHAIDATGVDKMLDKHAGAFQKHFEKTVRKMNG